jgi:hypothetical protein
VVPFPPVVGLTGLTNCGIEQIKKIEMGMMELKS